MSRPINFTDTTVIKKPYVEIDGVEYEVQDGTYQGGTDLNANTFNTMQDELNVFRNLLNKNSIINISDYTTSLSGNYKGYKYQLKPNTIYTLTCNNNNVTMSGSWIYRVYNSDNTSICILQDGSITSQITKTTFTTTSDGYIYFAHLYGTQDKLNTFLNTVDIQIEEGTTATSYVPYIPYNVENAISGTDWKDIACQGTYSNFDANNYDKFQYKQVGNQVFLRGLLKNSSVPVDASYAVTGILPEEARPKKTAYFMAATQSSNPIECSVSQYGEVRLLNKEANTWISVNGLSFFID